MHHSKNCNSHDNGKHLGEEKRQQKRQLINCKIQTLVLHCPFYFALLILCTVSHPLKTTMKREEAKATGMAAVSAEREQTTSGPQKKSGNVTHFCGLPGLLAQFNCEYRI